MKAAAFLLLFALALLSFMPFSQGFDFFYLVLQWPGSYCHTQQSCCYPTSGKPAADFKIHGLWPSNKDGSYPSDCHPNYSFDASKIIDLITNLNANWPSLACPSSDSHLFWAHEWKKHGTCAEPKLDQHGYFQATLHLKEQANILQILNSAGIEPNDNSYSSSTIKGAIQGGIGYTPGIECNTDESASSQLFQVYLCVDTSASNFIQCPMFPSEGCPPHIKFPSF